MVNFLGLIIKPFVHSSFLSTTLSIFGLFLLFLFSFYVFYKVFRLFFIKNWLSETKVAQVNVISLTKNKKQSAFKTKIKKQTIDEDDFGLIINCDKIKSLLIKNEELANSIEDGDYFTLEYKEKFEFLVFNKNKKSFLNFIPIRATLKNGKVILLKNQTK